MTRSRTILTSLASTACFVHNGEQQQASCRRHRSIRWGWAVMILVLSGPLATTPAARAQDEAVAGEAADVEEEELAIDEGFEIHVSNFDRWIFGAQNAQQGTQRVKSELSLNVEAVHRTCGLTEAQMAKLELAGQGDVKRFLSEVQTLRERFMKVRRNRNAFGKIWEDIRPLQAKFNAGLFGESSFFNKVLRRTLNDEQSSKYEEAMWQRKQARYLAKLKLVVAIMERNMPLRAEQREQFIDVLRQETKPPMAFGQYDYYVVLFQVAKVPEEKLKPIFDEPQWKVLKLFTTQAQGMEPWLKQQKLLP
jgi:hypothetical protein